MNPDELLKRINITVLYNIFLERIKVLLQNCAKQGAVYYATSGLRTYDEQNALYAKGRTAPGGKVTNAKGGYSPHNFCLAIDFCRDADLNKTGLQPDYKDASYKILADEARLLGLEPGYYWTSFPDHQHVQMPLKSKGITWAKLRELYDQGGYPLVFKFLDSQGGWWDP